MVATFSMSDEDFVLEEEEEEEEEEFKIRGVNSKNRQAILERCIFCLCYLGN